MVLDECLDLLAPVRKSGRGWVAKCPAHQDRSPSLSIRETEDRVLLHCFAGCSVSAICEAMGIRLRDLFTGAFLSEEWEQVLHNRIRQRQAEYRHQIEVGRMVDARREAEALLKAGGNQDISQWSIEKFDRVMDGIGQALELLRNEDEDYFYEHIGRTAERI